jgi:hypothetical protein
MNNHHKGWDKDTHNMLNQYNVKSTDWSITATKSLLKIIITIITIITIMSKIA